MCDFTHYGLSLRRSLNLHAKLLQIVFFNPGFHSTANPHNPEGMSLVLKGPGTSLTVVLAENRPPRRADITI
jgi:hypothetical protein